MSRPTATCSLPSCRREAAFASSTERGTLVLCARHHERLRDELGGDHAERRLRGDRAARHRLAALVGTRL